MKLSNPSPRFLFASILTLLVTMLSSFIAQANPFASAITNTTGDTSGTIQFYLNESTTNTWVGYTQAVNITVVYDDGTTNASFNGITTGINQQSGLKSFPLSGHTGFQIICHRDGTGSAYTNSIDYGATNGAPLYTGWPSPRGVDANRNAKLGNLFGRVYVGNSSLSAPNQTFQFTNPPVLTPLAAGQDQGYTNTASITNTLTVTFADTTTTNVQVIATRTSTTPVTYTFPNTAVTSGSGQTVNVFTNVPAFSIGTITAVLVTTNGPGAIFNISGPVVVRDWGIYAITPDLSTNALFQGPSAYLAATTNVWSLDRAAGSTSGPYRIRVADDGSIFVTDFGTAGGGLWQFGPNFEYTNLVFSPVGENQGIAAGTHGDPQSVFTYGSIASGNLTVWTVDPGLGAPATNVAPNFSSNSIGGFIGVSGYTPTLVGDYNNIFRYDVGAGDPAHYTIIDMRLAATGSGYNAFGTNDILVISGGTVSGNPGATNAVIVVTATNGSGGITAFTVVNSGDYSVAPTSPNSLTSTGGGTGTGAKLHLFLARVLWSQAPQFAACLGLPNFFDNQNLDLTLSPDHSKVYASFRRLNNSDGNLQIFDTTQPGIPRVFTSLREVPPVGSGSLFDAWVGPTQGANGNYAGLMISPDGRFFASVEINNDITIATMTNGIPDESTIFRIPNLSATANARGMCWDAAGNLLVCSSGQGQLRSISLGNSSTCITSNDFSTTNGTFQLLLPPVSASLAVLGNASQNYVNNNLLVPPLPTGSPIPGVFRISLNTNSLPAPLVVSFTLGGTAINPTHYTLSTNGGVPGLVLAGSTLTFPAGTAPSGNWTADLLVTPTATPLFTNTMTVTMNVNRSSTYLTTPPIFGTVFITNTGPQVLLLGAAQAGTTMYRGVTNDYAEFIITRLGDPAGPGNSPGNVNPTSYTVTNFTYLSNSTAAANFPGDYTAGPQNWNQSVAPVDGSPGIVVNPGDASSTNVVGNPVLHGNLGTPPTNAIITLTLATTNNPPTGPNFNTNLLSFEGKTYWVVSNAVAVTELDNRVGPEVVLYRNPLTNALDSANWTLTFAATNMTSLTPPLTNNLIVVPQYTNNYQFDGLHDFYCSFGFDPSTDPLGPIAPSPAMIENGWSNVLKMTVNKNDTVSPAGLNAYPGAPGAFTNFGGNFALRFNMYLQLHPSAVDNPFRLVSAREFAAFGVNHQGTNCNWRIAAPINTPSNPGNDRTNQDGVWFTVDASTLSLTPADFDMFTPPPTPNAGYNVADRFSQGAQGQRGVFKSKPFDAVNTAASAPGNIGGEPVDKWVDVSVEITKGTNMNLFINKSSIFGNVPMTNQPTGVGLGYTNGTIMLGYLDPVRDAGGNSPIKQFVYYSNVRVVELSPYAIVQARASNSGQTNFIVAQFATNSSGTGIPDGSLTFTSACVFASAPITNVWYRGLGTFTQPNTGTPTLMVGSNYVNATSMNDSYTQVFTNAATATNYMNVFSDAAGSVTSRVVAVEVVLGPTNQNFNLGSSSNKMSIVVAGPSAPTAYQWYFNTASNFAGATKLANGNKYGSGTGYGVTTTNLFITNIVAGDAGFYWCTVSNLVTTNVGVAGSFPFAIPQAAQLSVTIPPTSATASPSSQVNLWGSNTTFNVAVSGGTSPFTYQWKKGGVNLANSTHVGGATGTSVTLTNITAADTGNYTVGVSNSAGGVISSTAVLTEFTPFPITGASSVSGGNFNLSFSSTNGFDTSSSFILQSAGVVTDPYTNNNSAVFSGSNPNFSVSAPMTGDTMFYRLKHVD